MALVLFPRAVAVLLPVCASQLLPECPAFAFLLVDFLSCWSHLRVFLPPSAVTIAACRLRLVGFLSPAAVTIVVGAMQSPLAQSIVEAFDPVCRDPACPAPNPRGTAAFSRLMSSSSSLGSIAIQFKYSSLVKI